MPRPVQAPAATVFDEVTKGYVPKSMSSIVPWAPSARTRLPFPETHVNMVVGINRLELPEELDGVKPFLLKLLKALIA